MNVEVLEFGEDKLCWNFESELPFFYVPDGSYGRPLKVDPFPAYAHEAGLVRSEIERAALLFPIPQKVTVCVLHREATERTNGWTSIGWHYNGDDAPRTWDATIVLQGKRIPPHPAMTRYLVAHEYGHAVAQYLRWKAGEKDGSGESYKSYRALRGAGEEPKHYGGGTWHTRTEELFANDFRILVTNAETEFWPHPGYQRPEELPGIRDFWENETRKAVELNANASEKAAERSLSE